LIVRPGHFKNPRVHSRRRVVLFVEAAREAFPQALHDRFEIEWLAGIPGFETGIEFLLYGFQVDVPLRGILVCVAVASLSAAASASFGGAAFESTALELSLQPAARAKRPTSPSSEASASRRSLIIPKSMVVLARE
jgi:hypothetical protein